MQQRKLKELAVIIALFPSITLQQYEDVPGH